MSVETTQIKETSPGNGVATVFSFDPIVIFEAGDLKAVITEIATGIETPIAQGPGPNDFTVVVPKFPGTGSVIYPSDEVTPLPTGFTITMFREMVFLQPTVLNNQGGYFAKVQEDSFDRLTFYSQQLDEESGRSFTFPISYTGGASTQMPIPEALAFLRWNGAADALENAIVASSGAAVFPPLSTDDAIVRFDGTDGKTFQNSNAIIDDAGNLTLAVALGLLSGGTGATTAPGARTNLGLDSVDNYPAPIRGAVRTSLFKLLS